MIMGQLTILPKHWWTGKDASGNQRDPMKTTLEPPLGSGPYRIKEVKPGRSIAYERVTDYWGKDLPVNAGQWNYDDDPLRVLPRRDRRLRELQGRQSRLLAGDERQELGHRLRFRRGAQRLRQAPGGAARTHAADAVLRAQSAAPAICRTGACGKRSISPSTSSGPTRICSTANMRGSAAISRAASLPRRRRCPRDASSRS